MTNPCDSTCMRVLSPGAVVDRRGVGCVAGPAGQFFGHLPLFDYLVGNTLSVRLASKRWHTHHNRTYAGGENRENENL